MSDYDVGLLINFNVRMLKEELRRMRAWSSLCVLARLAGWWTES